MFRHLPKGPRAPRKISSGEPRERGRMESGSEAALSTSQNIHSDPAILVQHLNAAYNLARYLMRDEIEAEDVVQTAYLLAIRHFAVGGAEKRGHYGREKGASDVVTQWPAAGATAPDVSRPHFQAEWFSANFAFSAR